MRDEVSNDIEDVLTSSTKSALNKEMDSGYSACQSILSKMTSTMWKKLLYNIKGALLDDPEEILAQETSRLLSTTLTLRVELRQSNFPITSGRRDKNSRSGSGTQNNIRTSSKRSDPPAVNSSATSSISNS